MTKFAGKQPEPQVQEQVQEQVPEQAAKEEAGVAVKQLEPPKPAPAKLSPVQRLIQPLKVPTRPQPIQRPVKEEFLMPSAKVGMSVLWFPHGETQGGTPAVVSHVGEKTLSLHIFLNLRNHVMYKDGVRHILDPEAKREEYIDAGAWDYSEVTKDNLRMQSDIERLRSIIESRK